MDLAIIIFGIIGVILFGAYVFFIIKTAHDDEKNKKKKHHHQNGTS
ncbi:MAG: hypothetical protein N2510_01210 [Ignavibacteria bacterium]|nr:hypothetical protein [Ignavibacteria bacterium]